MCSRSTALRLHEQTSPALFEVWIAIGRMEHPPPLDYPSLRIVRISPVALAVGMATSQQGSALVRAISAAKTVAGGKVSRREGRRVVAASRVHARGSRKILLTRRVARQDRLRSVRSSRLLLFAQQMVRRAGLRFSYCIAVGGTPTNFAPSLVEQRGVLERTAFSACQRLYECLCGSARGCTVPGIGINDWIRP